MVKKAHQNPKGGLNAKGRAHFKSKGQNLKSPVKSGDNPRRASFLARMSGVKGPMMKNGKPTRKKLALQAWGAGSVSQAKSIASGISKRNAAKKKRSA